MSKDFIDLSKFTKLQKIGEGSFGKVFTIKDNSTGIIYAGKISKKPINEDDKSLIINLKREINIIAKLNHPSVLKFIGYNPNDFNHKPNPIIITEYSSNGSLKSIIQLERQSLAPSEWNDTKKLINIFGIASAMAYLHSKNILHRDLKPENILEDYHLFPKIADFGLSKSFHENKESMTLESTAGIKGTPIYIPPESWTREEYSKSGDVYAFSLIVYEIMTNDEPFQGFDLPKLYSKVIYGGYRPEFKHPIEKCYEQLITKCWSANPDERPTFDDIIYELKNNDEFITESIDKDEYLDFIDLIENYNKGKESTKSFKKITLSNNKINISKLNEKVIEFESFSNSDKVNKLQICKEADNTNDIIKFSKEAETVLYQELNKIDAFKKLSNETKNFVKNAVKRQNSDNDTFIIHPNETANLFINDILTSDNFIQVLKNFQSIIIEVKYPSNIFELILKVFSSLLDTKQLKAISFTIYVSDTDKLNSYSKILSCFPHNIIITNAISTIKINDFDCFSSLTEISISHSVSLIGNYAFKGCKTLEKIVIPSNVTSIGKGAFQECSSLKQILIPSSITKIEKELFWLCISLSHISIPMSITEIGSSSFSDCESLTEINIPVSITKIEDSTLFNCKSLSKISIPSCVTEIKFGAFDGCLSLVEISIPSSVTLIGQYAFSECSSLTQIIIPSSVISIGDYAFSECSLLTQISIPSSVKKIGTSIFSDCKSLKKIVIPKYLEEIPEYSFYGCSSLTEIDFGEDNYDPYLTDIGRYAFSGCSSIEYITLPDSVRKIHKNAFENCTSLLSIQIPSTCKKINLLKHIGINKKYTSVYYFEPDDIF